jgi:serine/threonine protein kinase
MIPAFVRAHETDLIAALRDSRPDLTEALAGLGGAFEAGLSPLDLLLGRGSIAAGEILTLQERLPPRSLTWGPFRVGREVGRGAGGVVFRAYDEAAGQEVALKLFRAPCEGLNSVRVGRFRREVQLLERLRHPALAAVHLAGEEEGQLFLATHWLPGGSLEERGRQAPALAISWIERLSDGLAHAHAHGVLHRDLSPRNVVLASDGSPVLVDFGLAKDASGAALTASQLGLGSPAYAAPEQLGAASGAGAPSDVYGLTALLYFLLVGQPPFASTSWSALLRAIQAGPPRLPEGVSPRGELDHLLAWGLDEDPRVRATLPELRKGLRSLELTT